MRDARTAGKAARPAMSDAHKDCPIPASAARFPSPGRNVLD